MNYNKNSTIERAIVWNVKIYKNFSGNRKNIRKKKSKIVVIYEGYAIWLEKGKKSLQVDKKIPQKYFTFPDNRILV